LTAYDRIGATYATTRQPDPLVARLVREAVGSARSVVNVGAGSGSYEPADLHVVAVEPSRTMLAQRLPGSAPAVQAVAEALPFPHGAFDCATALLTVHHWSDPARGFAELRRVARRQVVLTWDPEQIAERSWMFRDYLPEALAREADLPTLRQVLAELPGAQVVPVPVARDCVDGFAMAFWARPHAYLDPVVRAGISSFALLDPAVVDAAVARLAADLADGTWAQRNASLAGLDALDVGYRLVVT
jgi:SAM-dependent methyltransferase